MQVQVVECKFCGNHFEYDEKVEAVAVAAGRPSRCFICIDDWQKVTKEEIGEAAAKLLGTDEDGPAYRAARRLSAGRSSRDRDQLTDVVGQLVYEALSVNSLTEFDAKEGRKAHRRDVAKISRFVASSHTPGDGDVYFEANHLTAKYGRPGGLDGYELAQNTNPDKRSVSLYRWAMRKVENGLRNELTKIGRDAVKQGRNRLPDPDKAQLVSGQLRRSEAGEATAGNATDFHTRNSRPAVWIASDLTGSDLTGLPSTPDLPPDRSEHPDTPTHLVSYLWPGVWSLSDLSDASPGRRSDAPCYLLAYLSDPIDRAIVAFLWEWVIAWPPEGDHDDPKNKTDRPSDREIAEGIAAYSVKVDRSNVSRRLGKYGKGVQGSIRKALATHVTLPPTREPREYEDEAVLSNVPCTTCGSQLSYPSEVATCRLCTPRVGGIRPLCDHVPSGTCPRCVPRSGVKPWGHAEAETAARKSGRRSGGRMTSEAMKAKAESRAFVREILADKRARDQRVTRSGAEGKNDKRLSAALGQLDQIREG